jgi:hypothetical protein
MKSLVTTPEEDSKPAAREDWLPHVVDVVPVPAGMYRTRTYFAFAISEALPSHFRWF